MSTRSNTTRLHKAQQLPCPKVPQDGLSEDNKKRLHQCRDCANQILKAALEINGSVLAEMEIPSAYLDTLPKVQVSISMPIDL